MDVGCSVGPFIEDIPPQSSEFDFIEIIIGEQEIEPEEIDNTQLRQQLSEKGFDLVVHLPFRQPLATTVPTFNDAVVEYLDTMLAAANRIGASKAVVHPNFRDRDEENQIEILRKQIERMNGLQEEYDIELCYENVDHLNTLPVLELADLLTDIGASMCFDIGHAYQGSSDEDIDKFLRNYTDIVSHLHVHDIRERGDSHILPGEGQIDYPHVVGHLEDFEGTACLEVFTEDPDYNANAREKFLSYF